MSAREEWRRGGPVVAGAALGLGTSFAGYHYVASIFVPHLSAAFGWTRGEIATAGAAALAGSLVAPFAGRLVDRAGVRPVAAAGAVLTALGYVLLSRQTGSLGLYAALIALTATAGLAGGALAYTRAVAGWFNRGRGLALGLTIAGVSLFAILVPPALSAVIAAHGWRGGYLLLAALTAGVGLPALLLLVRERRAAGPARAVPEPGLPWADIRRSRAFWLLCGAVACAHLSGAGIIAQLAPMLADRRIAPATVPLLLSALGVAVLAGRVGLGLLLDRLPPLRVGAAALALPALGAALLISDTASVPVALVAVVLVGLSQGAEMDLVAFLIARRFGMRAYSATFGAVITVLALSGAGGAALFGRTFDSTGGYAAALTLVLFAAPLGGALLLAIGREQVQPRSAVGTA